MEQALRYELNKIPEINNKIFPTNAPEGETAPYLVYIVSKRPLKTLEGTTKDRETNIMLNVFCNSYSEMKSLNKKVEDLIITFPLRSIGDNGPYIEDLTMDESSEAYESELQLQRGIIPFTICYKEE